MRSLEKQRLESNSLNPHLGLLAICCEPRPLRGMWEDDSIIQHVFMPSPEIATVEGYIYNLFGLASAK